MPNSQRITPLLVYEGIEAAHDFLVRAFGLEGGRIDRDDEGRVVHGEVYTGSEAIWLHPGARIDSAPIDQPYGRREYGARDPEGHRWWFGTPLSHTGG